MANQNDIRQSITNQIIVPLSRQRSTVASSVAAGQERRGTRQRRQQEVLQGTEPHPALDLPRREARLPSKWWGTFNQWKALGGRVMRRPDHVPQGSGACQICFWTPVTKTVQNEQGRRGGGPLLRSQALHRLQHRSG